MEKPNKVSPFFFDVRFFRRAGSFNASGSFDIMIFYAVPLGQIAPCPEGSLDST